jgi:diguanylate cyclase (GGDEF)-like protein
MSTSSQKVLIVDDSRSDRMLLRRFLDGFDGRSFEVEEAIAGRIAVEMVRESPPDCMLLDYRLSDMTGLELLQRIQDDDGHVPSAVVMMTGHGSEGVAVQAMKSGALDYLSKMTFDAAHLVKTIDTAIDRKRKADDLMASARIDPLTALPNRAAILERLDLAMSRLKRYMDHRFSVLFLDLDGFKQVNDSMGHVTGDLVLVEVASRLRASVRPSDAVARLGGDEFVVLVEHIVDDSEALLVVERIERALMRPIIIDGCVLHVSASIGVATSEGVPGTSSELLEQADAAMYRAKALGKARHVLYGGEGVTALPRRTADEVVRALVRRELRLHFQPIVDLELRAVVGIESFLRWEHPDRGMLTAGQFLYSANDLADEVEHWVLERSCQEAARLAEKGHVLRVRGNVTERNLLRADFVELVGRVLAKTGLPPEQLEFEVPERLATIADESAIEILGKLCESGVGLVLDDLGTGSTSLSTLLRLPIQTVKVDRLITRDMSLDGGDQALIETLVSFARVRGNRVAAEGVEHEEQVTLLRDRGCHEVQGRLVAPPLSSEDLPIFLDRFAAEAAESPEDS